MPLAREGHWPLAALLALGLLVGLFIAWPLSLPVWVVLVLGLFVFRQPPRAVEAAPLNLLSPIDGRVRAVDTAQDPLLDRSARRISLHQNLFGPYVVYAPTEGRLQRLGGTWTVALLLRTDEGDELTLEVTRSRALRYLHCQMSAGERMRQGGVCGFAGFGRIVHLYLPADVRVEVAVGAKVRAGQPLAKLAPRAG
ncbi:hypothetical protein [Acidihalobacter ferrooxydans]|uniref:Phosphatidylserine decarboxylase n=1 Tax=Acidihalobacter ferrooxydans TaxID=1765967 RepID=A0A1P8UE61_9GAMM|nr:hypothetical protein [Acidihalobacter ferrooxydans]APZ42078.1 hypothetical protein BW247_02340 [Acidihalobacter ferrooxydans]